MLNPIGAVAGRPPRRWLAAAAGLAFGLLAALPAKAEDTIKVGILHSLSGTMAISETTLKDVVLMLIDELDRTANGPPLAIKIDKRPIVRQNPRTCHPGRGCAPLPTLPTSRACASNRFAASKSGSFLIWRR